MSEAVDALLLEHFKGTKKEPRKKLTLVREEALDGPRKTRTLPPDIPPKGWEEKGRVPKGRILREPAFEFYRDFIGLKKQKELFGRQLEQAKRKGTAGSFSPFSVGYKEKIRGDAIRSLLPGPGEISGKMIVPFFGDGTNALALEGMDCVLADDDGDLIGLYTVIRYNLYEFIDVLSKMERDREYFESLRNLDRDKKAFEGLSFIEKMARYYYLATTSQEQRYMRNLHGHCVNNFRQERTMWVPDMVSLWQTHEALSRPGILLREGSHLDVLVLAEAGDFVYLDPPKNFSRQNWVGLLLNLGHLEKNDVAYAVNAPPEYKNFLKGLPTKTDETFGLTLTYSLRGW